MGILEPVRWPLYIEMSPCAWAGTSHLDPAAEDRKELSLVRYHDP